MNILIVGHGFVGKAVEYGFSTPFNTLEIVDPKYGTRLETANLAAAELIFVCVPTPMSLSGAIDDSILSSVLKYLLKHISDNQIIIVKSTVTPEIIKQFIHPQLVYSPEFLREATAKQDFVNPEFHVFGGIRATTSMLEYIYDTYSNCKKCPVHLMSWTDAAFVKYAINTFLATKVTFFNQLFDVVEEHGANYASIVKAIENDSRIGSSHTRVPGFDGKRGFGGSCFPKDTAAFVNFSDKLSLLATVLNINNNYRKHYELDARELEQNVSFKKV